MKSLSLSLLGLVLIGIPACLAENTDKQCFSQPTYPCCKGGKVVYIDESGYWGVEDGEWCGIEQDSSNSCFSIPLGYSCCKQCDVLYTDESGKWGVENGEWCGINKNCTLAKVIQGDPNFDLLFLKLENNKKNMIYSSLSIKYALHMLLEGAQGNTYTEISKVVGNKELGTYETINGVISLANGLFIRDSLYSYVKTSYIDTLKDKCKAEIIKDSFGSAKNANDWVKEKTFGLIKNILSDDVVTNPENQILLINALAIDMQWADKFDTMKTTGKPFYTRNGESIIAKTMCQETTSSNVAYYKNDDITVLTMDLKFYGGRFGVLFEFMAIMPNNNDLSDYVKNVTREDINNMKWRLNEASSEPYGVKLYIPRFKFSYDLSLKDDLMNLGIKDVFDKNKSDLSKIADPNFSLYVSNALQKAEIEFSEDGIKAAAASAVEMVATKHIPTYPVVVEIDKPFMFIIRDTLRNDIWFTGTVYEPEKY